MDGLNKGMEMMLGSLLKLLGLTPDKIIEFQNVAQNINAVVDEMRAELKDIRADQKRILAMLEPPSADDVVNGSTLTIEERKDN